MSIYDELNSNATKAKKSLEEEKNNKMKIKEKNDLDFINYMISYLEPFIIKMAQEVIKNGKVAKESIDINDIVFGYPKTVYIIQTFKNPYDEPVYCYLRAKIDDINSLFCEKLSEFMINIKPRRENGFFRAHHYIDISVDLKK